MIHSLDILCPSCGKPELLEMAGRLDWGLLSEKVQRVCLNCDYQSGPEDSMFPQETEAMKWRTVIPYKIELEPPHTFMARKHRSSLLWQLLTLLARTRSNKK